MTTFNSIGTLHYRDERWCSIVCDTELARYYRAQINDKKIMLPMWGTHITVVNGRWEKALKREHWGKYEGEKVEFSYSNDIQYESPFYFMFCRCERIGDLREELGLKRVFAVRPLHLTLGRNAPSGRAKVG